MFEIIHSNAFCHFCFSTKGGLKHVFLNALLFAGGEGQERQQGGQRG